MSSAQHTCLPLAAATFPHRPPSEPSIGGVCEMDGRDPFFCSPEVSQFLFWDVMMDPRLGKFQEAVSLVIRSPQDFSSPVFFLQLAPWPNLTWQIAADSLVPTKYRARAAVKSGRRREERRDVGTRVGRGSVGPTVTDWMD